MRFLAIGEDGSLGDIYMRLVEQGHEVKVYIADPSCHGVLAGLITRTENWRDELRWIREAGRSGIIIFEDTSTGALQNTLRTEGYQVVGGSAYGDRLENDRLFGQSELRAVGHQTAASFEFTSYEEARSFIRKRPHRYVLKYCCPGFGCSRNYVGELDDGSDVDGLIVHAQTRWSRSGQLRFILMDHVVGVEVGVGAYFNGRHFLDAVVIDWEHKRFFNGDIGELTGEMGTLLSYRNSQRLFRETLEPMTDRLSAAGHVGYVNINTILNEQGVWPLEFTCRFGYPGAAICDTLHLEGWDELFLRMVRGDRLDFQTATGFAVGVLLTVPPYPSGDRYDEISKGLPILFRFPPTEEDWRNMHFSDIELRDGQIIAGGELGALMIVTGSGNTVEAARQTAYNRCRNVVVPGLRYRTDIGQRFLHKDQLLMEKWGYPQRSRPAPWSSPGI